MNRRHGWLFLLFFLAGCSTHPVTDLCDYFKPGTLGPNKVQPYGGVAIPQGPIVPVVPATGPLPPAFPGGGVVPPPAPLPGGQPFQPQPPQPIFPPLPPAPPPGFGR